MAIEIERKFLVAGNDWREGENGVDYRQGYLSIDPKRSVRIRIFDGGGFLTFKGASEGFSRLEFEYEIPVRDAKQMLTELCLEPLIEKRRYRRSGSDGLIWEIDEFRGLNEGLVIAEIELETESQLFALPPWIGEEVSDDSRYYNSSLVAAPYSEWCRTEKNR